MKLRKLLWWISDFLYLKLLGGASVKREVDTRNRKIIETLIKILGPLEPYVLDGKWKWFQTSSGYHHPLLFVAPEKGLVVQSWGPEVQSWDKARLYCKNKTKWEVMHSLSALLRVKCIEFQFPLLEVNYNDPIDEDTVREKLHQLLDVEAED